VTFLVDIDQPLLALLKDAQQSQGPQVTKWADSDGSTLQVCVDYQNFNAPNFLVSVKKGTLNPRKKITLA